MKSCQENHYLLRSGDNRNRSMAEKLKRPVLIWITQILLCLIAMSLLSGVIFLVRELWARHSVRTNGIGIGAVFFLIIVVSLIAFWDLLNRRKSGKWLAAACLMVAWVVVVFIVLLPRQDSGQAANGQLRITFNPSFEERVYSLVTLAWLHVLVLAPAVGLLVSKKVDRFLDKPSSK
jgi:hypothetical protein